MSQKHIVINKIENKSGAPQLLLEGISIDEIRSFRKWNNKDADKYEDIPNVIVLYMKDPRSEAEKRDQRPKQIHISEDMEKFCARLGVSVPELDDK